MFWHAASTHWSGIWSVWSCLCLCPVRLSTLIVILPLLFAALRLCKQLGLCNYMWFRCSCRRCVLLFFSLLCVCSEVPLCEFALVLAHRPETDLTQTNTVYDPHSTTPVLHCSQSYYGCCPDGHTPAGGPQGLGCPRGPARARPSCTRSRFLALNCHHIMAEVPVWDVLSLYECVSNQSTREAHFY